MPNNADPAWDQLVSADADITEAVGIKIGDGAVAGAPPVLASLGPGAPGPADTRN